MDKPKAKSVLEDMVHQFAPTAVIDDKLYIWTGGFSALEDAFAVLEWSNPHEIPERECDMGGCSSHATCGTPTPDGYKNVCGMHFSELTKDV